jgi:hypothetical protein
VFFTLVTGALVVTVARGGLHITVNSGVVPVGMESLPEHANARGRTSRPIVGSIRINCLLSLRRERRPGEGRGSIGDINESEKNLERLVPSRQWKIGPNIEEFATESGDICRIRDFRSQHIKLPPKVTLSAAVLFTLQVPAYGKACRSVRVDRWIAETEGADERKELSALFVSSLSRLSRLLPGLAKGIRSTE